MNKQIVSTLAGVFSVITVAASSSVSHGAILANYDFSTNTGSTTAASSSSVAASVAGVTASAFMFTINSNESPGGFQDLGFSSSVSNHVYVRSSATGSTQANALADDDFLTFTVTAGSGKKLNLTSLTFDLGGSSNSGSTLNNTLYVSAGGVVTGSASSTILSNNTTVFTNKLIALTGAAYQNLQSITFRLAFADDQNSDLAVNRLDNVVLNGTVATPEPASLSTIALAGVGLLGRRRRAK